MADILVSQDPTKPGVNKLNGPTLTASGDVPLAGLDTTGAVNGNVIVLAGGVWTPGAGGASSDTASNVGTGSGLVFKQKTGANFEFRSLLAGTGITVTNNTSDITIASTGVATFLPTGYTSPDQVLVPAGALVLAHGLGGVPRILTYHIRNTSAEHGYVPGDILQVPPGSTDSANGYGIAVTPDATNINIRYGITAGVFVLLNKTTGGFGNPADTTKWVFVVQAWR